MGVQRFSIFSSGGHLVYQNGTTFAILVGNHLGTNKLKGITDRWTDGRIDGQAQTNMPPELLRSWGHKNMGLLFFHVESIYNVSGTYTNWFPRYLEGT